MFGLSRRVLAGVGVALALAVAGVGGVALADTPAPTPTATTSTGSTTTTQKTDYGQVFLAKLAAALGIDQAKVESAIKQAESDTLDQAVANGDLAKNSADATKQQIQQNPVDLFHIRGLDGEGRGGPGHGSSAMSVVDNTAVQKAVADKLGLSVTDLQTQLQSKTLAALAKEKNVQVQDLYDAAANAAKPQLDQAVKDGKITQAQADQIFQQLQMGQYVLRGQGMMGGGPGPMRGGPGPMGRGVGRFGR